VLDKKILTWDSLQKRGWEGPSLCVLCKSNSKDINHLFIDCVFTKKIWERLKFTLKIKRKWEGKDMSDCFFHWIKDKSVSPSLVGITCWFIWLERNKATFENLFPSVHSIMFKVLGLYKLHSSTQAHVPIKDCMISYLDGSSIAFSFFFVCESKQSFEITIRPHHPLHLCRQPMMNLSCRDSATNLFKFHSSPKYNG